MATLPSISLNKETIGLCTGAIGLVVTLIGGYNWLLAGRAENAPVVQAVIMKNVEQDNRLGHLDQDGATFKENVKELTSKTGDLKDAVVKLTAVIEAGQNARKAEYIGPALPLSALPPGLMIEARR
jgi:hypothetical protein